MNTRIIRYWLFDITIEELYNKKSGDYYEFKRIERIKKKVNKITFIK